MKPRRATAAALLAAAAGVAASVAAAPTAAAAPAVTLQPGQTLNLVTGAVLPAAVAATITYNTPVEPRRLLVQSTGVACSTGTVDEYATWQYNIPDDTVRLVSGYLRNFSGRAVNVWTNKLVVNGVTRERYAGFTSLPPSSAFLQVARSSTFHPENGHPNAYWGIQVLASSRLGCGDHNNVHD